MKATGNDPHQVERELRNLILKAQKQYENVPVVIGQDDENNNNNNLFRLDPETADIVLPKVEALYRQAESLQSSYQETASTQPAA